MIKTVIIFLSNLLPVFIFLSFYRHFYGDLLCLNEGRNKWLVNSTVLLLILLMVPSYEYSGALFDGMGTEWLTISFIVFAMVMLLAVRQCSAAWQPALLRLALVLFAGLKFASFALYFLIEVKSLTSISLIVLSSLMGVGICLSFYVLWSFLLSELQDSLPKLNLLLLSLFVTGNIAAMVNHLHQIDAVSWGATQLMNLEFLLSEQQELGYILKALIGYESSPSQLFSLVYLVALPLSYFYLLRNRP